MSPIEQMLIRLKEMGFDLILVWMLSIAIIYGILTKIKMPESYSARGVIAIASGFLIMLASAGTIIPTIIQNIVVSLIVIGFVLLLIVIFLELMGIKAADTLQAHSNIILIILAVVVFLVFLSSGARNIFNNINIFISQNILMFVLFLIFASFVIWIMAKETGGGGGGK